MKNLTCLFSVIFLAVTLSVAGSSAQLLSISGGSATTWDPASKSAHALLSNGNLTATGDGTVGNFIGLATSSISGTQKNYLETTADVLVSTSPGFGLANVSESLANFLGATANSIGYFDNGQVFFNNTLVTTIATYTTGNVIGTAVDFALGKVWWRVNGGNWNNDIIANQNPATGTGGISIGVAGTVFPAYNLNTNAATTARFSSGSWGTAAPAGFVQLP